jgi:hypothetical protein
MKKTELIQKIDITLDNLSTCYFLWLTKDDYLTDKDGKYSLYPLASYLDDDYNMNEPMPIEHLKKVCSDSFSRLAHSLVLFPLKRAMFCQINGSAFCFREYQKTYFPITGVYLTDVYLHPKTNKKIKKLIKDNSLIMTDSLDIVSDYLLDNDELDGTMAETIFNYKKVVYFLNQVRELLVNDDFLTKLKL